VLADLVELPGDLGKEWMQRHCVTNRVVGVAVGSLWGHQGILGKRVDRLLEIGSGLESEQPRGVKGRAGQHLRIRNGRVTKVRQQP
jgi:hypothetical protein